MYGSAALFSRAMAGLKEKRKGELEPEYAAYVRVPSKGETADAGQKGDSRRAAGSRRQLEQRGARRARSPAYRNHHVAIAAIIATTSGDRLP